MFPNFGIFQMFGEDQTDFEIVVIVEAEIPNLTFLVVAYFHGLVEGPKLILVNLSFEF